MEEILGERRRCKNDLQVLKIIYYKLLFTKVDVKTPTSFSDSSMSYQNCHWEKTFQIVFTGEPNIETRHLQEYTHKKKKKTKLSLSRRENKSKQVTPMGSANYRAQGKSGWLPVFLVDLD